MRELFKIAFPVITLPENRGGKRAAVIFVVADRLQPSFMLATCIDSAGQPHMNVPTTRSEMAAASAKPMVLVEDPDGKAPMVGGGSGLVSATGQKL